VLIGAVAWPTANASTTKQHDSCSNRLWNRTRKMKNQVDSIGSLIWAVKADVPCGL